MEEKKKKGFKQRIKTTIYEKELGDLGKLKKIVITIRLIIASIRKFIVDDCFTKASSIAYTTLISLIPTLTVVLSFYSIFSGIENKKQEIFRKVYLLIEEYQINIDVDPIINVISGLVENAGRIGGIGLVVLILSATAILRTIDHSLNTIWRVKKTRPFFTKVVYYWAVLTLGPMLLIAGTTLSSKISASFSPPTYNSIAQTDQKKMWVAGNDFGLLKLSGKSLKTESLSKKQINFIDGDAFVYNNEKKQFESDNISLQNTNWKSAKLKKIIFKNNYGFVIGENGYVLTSDNYGKNWVLNKWGKLNLNDIYMFNEKKGMIIADNGVVLITNNSGVSWQLRNFYFRINYNLNSITFKNRTGYIVGDKGTILVSQDKGSSWFTLNLPETKKKHRQINLNRVCFSDGRNVYIIGDEGLILKSVDGGISWNKLKGYKNNFYTISFINPKSGLIAGENGTFLTTNDAGETWIRKKFSKQDIHYSLVTDKQLFLVGQTGMLLKSSFNKIDWKGSKGKAWVKFLIDFLMPFVLIWFLFLLMYKFLPNMKIPFKPAAIGASITSALWVVFILLFVFYIKSLATGTLSIYGAIAAFPLFLLLIYSSSVIFLFGAQMAYMLMHAEGYKNIKKKGELVHEKSVYLGIIILIAIYKKFEAGEGGSSIKKLIKEWKLSEEEMNYYIDIYLKNSYLVINNNVLFPNNSSENIHLKDIIHQLQTVTVVPLHSQPSKVESHIKDLFNKIEEAISKTAGKKNLKDLILLD